MQFRESDGVEVLVTLEERRLQLGGSVDLRGGKHARIVRALTSHKQTGNVQCHVTHVCMSGFFTRVDTFISK